MISPETRAMVETVVKADLIMAQYLDMLAGAMESISVSSEPAQQDYRAELCRSARETAQSCRESAARNEELTA